MDTFSFDFDSVDPVALEETLAYLREHPEPLQSDINGYQAMLADALVEEDFMENMQFGMDGESG